MAEGGGKKVSSPETGVNIKCKVCGKKASGFHFGVFACQGCKSFFGRMHDRKKVGECKLGAGGCEYDPATRNWCKVCRLRKCRLVGMSKSSSRHGRRSNWFKSQHFRIHSSDNNQQPDNSSEQSDLPDTIEGKKRLVKCQIRFKILSRIRQRTERTSSNDTTAPLDLSQKSANKQ